MISVDDTASAAADNGRFRDGRPAAKCGSRRQLGLHPGQDRSTTLFQLAADLPAALLARMFGIHITVAVAWQRASSGDWTQLRRRRQPPHGSRNDPPK